MSKHAQRHRSRDLRKKRARRGEGAGGEAGTAGVSLSTFTTPRGKGIPVVICGQTLSDVARALDLDQSYVSKLSRGKATPSLKVLRQLQEYLGLATMEETMDVLTEAGRVGEVEGEGG